MKTPPKCRPLNCPRCGRFMYLEFTENLYPDWDGPCRNRHGYAWLCDNDEACCYEMVKPIPAPDWDWLCCGYDDERLAEIRAEDEATYQDFVRILCRYQAATGDMRNPLNFVLPKKNGSCARNLGRA